MKRLNTILDTNNTTHMNLYAIIVLGSISKFNHLNAKRVMNSKKTSS